ncbi:MAG TPA: non-homologous end-joining DNA ligase [Candidatus Rhabdochlamydia sp.]|jgi:bifunctional non-homologous end joining protein LigD|nr:non-homologous end-joining DNA ligase [Candidatus Rhabdochlamydia sp.]
MLKKKSLKSDKEKLSLTHLDKIYWPKEKYTKADLLNYYEQVAPLILPYLKDRPIVLYRFPNGIQERGFYQKDINFSHPKWIKTYPVQHEGKVDHYLLINDLRSLLFAINLGSIDLHPFMSRCKQLEKPDYCVIDLDPHGVSFQKVVEVALIAHEILEETGVKHYCKTSGGNGLHIFIPLHAKYSYEQSRQFAELISLCIQKKIPESTSLERSPKKRQKKVYLDCLQNRAAQTVVAPYVVRPRPKALISTPLTWKEVNKELDPSLFTIKTVLPRFKKKGDLFKDVLTARINMKAALAHLHKFK